MTKRVCSIILSAVLLLSVFTCFAYAGNEFVVYSRDEYISALANAQTGDTIRLGSTIDDFTISKNITLYIGSFDISNVHIAPNVRTLIKGSVETQGGPTTLPQILNSLTVGEDGDGNCNVTFENIYFDYNAKNAANISTANCNNNTLTFKNCYMDGRYNLLDIHGKTGFNLTFENCKITHNGASAQYNAFEIEPSGNVTFNNTNVACQGMDSTAGAKRMVYFTGAGELNVIFNGGNYTLGAPEARAFVAAKQGTVNINVIDGTFGYDRQYNDAYTDSSVYLVSAADGGVIGKVSIFGGNFGKPNYKNCIIDSDYIGEGVSKNVNGDGTVSYSHTHIAGDDIIPEIPATCAKDGLKQHKVCIYCGVLLDLDGNPTTAVKLALTNGKHTLGNVIAQVDSTCTVQGTKAHRICTVCNAYFLTDDTPVSYNALKLPLNDNHDYQLVPATDSTCVYQGNIDYYTCTRCKKNFDLNHQLFTGSVLKDYGPHKYSNPTYVWNVDHICVAQKICLNGCSKTVTEAVQGVGVVSVLPSCTTTGVCIYTATFTSEGFETQTTPVGIDALGHDFHSGYCTRCATPCPCVCHQNNCKGFFKRLMHFFQKLFGKSICC